MCAHASNSWTWHSELCFIRQTTCSNVTKLNRFNTSITLLSAHFSNCVNDTHLYIVRFRYLPCKCLYGPISLFYKEAEYSKQPNCTRLIETGIIFDNISNYCQYNIWHYCTFEIQLFISIPFLKIRAVMVLSCLVKSSPPNRPC
jgi:hypothetical protein